MSRFKAAKEVIEHLKDKAKAKYERKLAEIAEMEKNLQEQCPHIQSCLIKGKRLVCDDCGKVVQ